MAQSRISYDTEGNTIAIPQTGANNVCLSLDYERRDYTIRKAQKYLVVKGQNLLTTSGSSYLWWLNGVNKGSQVVPTVTKTVSEGGEDYQLIAWDMTRSQLDGNLSGERPNITLGQTIFGLTWNGKSKSSSKRGAIISCIDFVENVDDVLAISHPCLPDYCSNGIGKQGKQQGVYDLKGRRVSESSLSFVPSVLPKGVYIVGSRKVVLP